MVDKRVVCAICKKPPKLKLVLGQKQLYKIICQCSSLPVNIPFSSWGCSNSHDAKADSFSVSGGKTR